ncbi:MAG TPA: HAD-IA family hydrolase [Glaciihabitans sp.]|jgi:putative hydrolase of the HAD superfamily|nr:HAD-IA family hydrolase [Glaciihabitans sp.]
MTLRIPSRVVVFDYGEVISLPPSEADRASLLAVADVAPEPFWASYWSHRDDLDHGTVDVATYWSRVADDVGAIWSPAELQMLWATDFRSWISVDMGTVAVLDELAAGGTRLALLSNAGYDFSSVYRYAPVGRYFERIFISAEMDAVKPDPDIYREVAAELEIELESMIFIDNKLVNTDAAAALGITAHHFVGADNLRAFLTTLAA